MKYLQATSENVGIIKTSASYGENNHESEENTTPLLTHSGFNNSGERLLSNIHYYIDKITPSCFR
jgi:hypothetical protein